MRDEEITAYARGMMGEDEALRYLTGIGLIPVARRYRSQRGEIDLIMTENDVLAMIEVKARKQGGTAAAQAAVTPLKQRRLIETALTFLSEHPEFSDTVVRFDVLTLSSDGIHYIRDAFQGREW